MDPRYLRLLLVLPLAVAFANGALIVAHMWPGPDGLSPTGTFFGSDFINVWVGGQLGASGAIATLYDLPAYNDVLKQWFGARLDGHIFSFMPNGLLFFLPFGQLPYFTSLFCWTLLGTAAYLAAILFRRPTRDDAWLIVALLISPIVWMNWCYGQFGLFIAAAFVAALRLLPTRPLIAGVLIGCLTVKPQLGLMLPFALLALGSWRAIASATVTALTIALVSCALFGIEAWQLYFDAIAPTQSRLMLSGEGAFAYHGVSIYFGLKLLGLGTTAALALHGLAAVLVIASTMLACRAKIDWSLKCTVIAAASVMVSPYVLSYDLAIPLAALVWHLQQSSAAPSKTDLRVVGALWIVPFAINFSLQLVLGVPTGALVTIAFFLWLQKSALGADIETLRSTILASRRAPA